MKILMTQSLLSSWLWMINGVESIIYGDGVKEFEQTLSKEYFDNKRKELGRNFEDCVYSVHKQKKLFVHNQLPAHPDSIIETARITYGGTWTVKGYREIYIYGITFLIYGKADIIRGPVIFDIKRVNQWYPGKYYGSPQHRMYFDLFPGCDRFDYVICDGDEVYIERYLKKDTEPINIMITEFIQWIERYPEYKRIFFEKWRCKNEN